MTRLTMSSREREPTRHFDFPRAVIAAAPFIAFGMFALLEWADWGSARDAGAKDGQKELAVWKGLVTAQVVVWIVLAGIGLRMLRQLDAHADAWFVESGRGWRVLWRWETLGFVLFIFAVIAAVFLPGAIVSGLNSPSVLTGQEWKSGLIFGAGFVALVPFLVVLKRVQLSAAEEGGWSTSARDVERIRVLRRHLRSATAFLGTVIALFVISSGALSEAVKAAQLPPLPDSVILVTGGVFTGTLAAIYLYVFTAVDGRARGILERAAPLADPMPSEADEFSASIQLRRDLGTELELGGDARKNLEGLIAVFSPLLAALLTRFAGL
jgi:hypothetical protein